MQGFISPLNALYLQYTLSTYATLTWAHKCNQLFFNLAQNAFTITYKYNMHKAKERPHITSSNRGEKGFLTRFTFSSCAIWSKLHYFRQTYTTIKTYRWTTWNSNRLLQGWLQVNSVTRAHHAIYPDWLQPFDVCATEISIYFHSGWHYRWSVALVT